VIRNLADEVARELEAAAERLVLLELILREGE